MVTEESGCSPPTRRVNASFIVNPLNSNELLLFGGERHDGQKCHLYNDFFKYKIDKNEWTKITSPNTPGPRSSHQMVATRKLMIGYSDTARRHLKSQFPKASGRAFLFGGEFVSPNETNFFHYKDFWTLDLKTNSFEKLEIAGKKRPSPRSGHRMTLWKQYLVLFGGFYDIGTDVR